MTVSALFIFGFTATINQTLRKICLWHFLIAQPAYPLGNACCFGGEGGILRFARGPLALRTAHAHGGAPRGGQTIHRIVCRSRPSNPSPSTAKKQHASPSGDACCFGGEGGIRTHVRLLSN